MSNGITKDREPKRRLGIGGRCRPAFQIGEFINLFGHRKSDTQQLARRRKSTLPPASCQRTSSAKVVPARHALDSWSPDRRNRTTVEGMECAGPLGKHLCRSVTTWTGTYGIATEICSRSSH